MCGSWNMPMFLFEGWVIDSDENCFFDVSGNTIVLPAHNAKIVWGHFMTCDVLVVYDGWWCSHVFPESFSQSSFWLSNVLLLTINPSTLVPINHPTFLQYGVLILGVYQKVSDGAASSETHLHSHASCRCFCWFLLGLSCMGLQYRAS